MNGRRKGIVLTRVYFLPVDLSEFAQRRATYRFYFSYSYFNVSAGLVIAVFIT